MGKTVSFSPDGALLATVDYSTDVTSPSTLRIWDVSGASTDRSRSRDGLLNFYVRAGWFWEFPRAPDPQRPLPPGSGGVTGTAMAWGLSGINTSAR